MDKSYNGFMLSDSHFPLGAEAGIPRQQPEAGTNTFIYMLEICAKVGDFQLHHQFSTTIQAGCGKLISRTL